MNDQDVASHHSKPLVEPEPRHDVIRTPDNSPVRSEREATGGIPLGSLKLELPASFFEPLSDDELDAWGA